MASPIDSLIETLTETRAKLDEQLGRSEAYRALQQLEHREMSGERLHIVPADQLRQALEAELGTDSTYKMRRKIDASLAMLAAWSKAGIVLPPLDSATADAPAAEGARPQSEAPEPAEPPAAEPVEAPPARLATEMPPAESEPLSSPDAAGLPSDDLSLVRDLPVACISVVTAAGYGRYELLAAIDSAGVALLERLLGQPGIVSRGNWIEQAAVLAQGHETRYAARLIALRTGAEWPPHPQSPDIVAPPATVAAPEPVPVAAASPGPVPDPRPAEPNDLTHIAGIDHGLAARLSADGTTFAQIALWTSRDVAAAATALAIPPARISAEGWIEQAALLSAGRPTRYLAAKPVVAPVVALPPMLDIPLDEEAEPASDLAAEPQTAAEVVEPSPPAEPIVVPAAANDDPPPNNEIEPPPPIPPAIWPAAAAKAAILRPLRKPTDRAGKAFDDVAALVAQTVATARNVGGRAERLEAVIQPPSGPMVVPVEPEPSRAAVVAEPVVAATTPAPAAETPVLRPPPRSPAPVATPASLSRVAPRAPADDQRPPPRRRVESLDPEASIEFRPRVTASAAPSATAQLRANDIGQPSVASVAPAAARTASPGGLPRTLVATARQGATAETAPAPRRVVVIDEIARTAPAVEPVSDRKPSTREIGARASGFLNRLVKALKGDTPD